MEHAWPIIHLVDCRRLVAGGGRPVSMRSCTIAGGERQTPTQSHAEAVRCSAFVPALTLASTQGSTPFNTAPYSLLCVFSKPFLFCSSTRHRRYSASLTLAMCCDNPIITLACAMGYNSRAGGGFAVLMEAITLFALTAHSASTPRSNRCPVCCMCLNTRLACPCGVGRHQ